MNRVELIRRVRSLTRDFSNSIFREQDIVDFLNEAIERFKQVIPELRGTEKLLYHQQQVTHIPEEYQHLIAVYATSRCFNQDERHYQATNYMNEFEIKLDELKEAIENGDVSIIDPETGESVEVEGNKVDAVNLYDYWGVRTHNKDGVL